MLSRWTKKDASSQSGGGSGAGVGGERHAGSSSNNGGQSALSSAAATLAPHDKERTGTDGLTPSERTLLEGMERFYGMENFGNTCYANSVVQALFFCRPFRDCVNTYPSLLSPYSPTDTPPSDLSLQMPDSNSSGGSSPLMASPGDSVASPVQSPSATRTSRWPGSKRILSSGHAKGDSSADGASSLEPPPASKRDRSRSPSRTRTSLQQPSYPPPATLFDALQSLFQHISSIPPPSYVISPNKDKDGNPPVPVPSVSKVIAPAAFIAKLKVENVMFQGSMQQDAHEFLNFLLNKIGEDLAAEDRERRAAAKAAAAAARALAAEDMANSTGSVSTAGAPPLDGVGKAEPTFVQKLFEGTLVNETRCLTCETTSSRDESFLDLSIDIEQNSSVTACLRQFSASETLCQKNKFYCDTCCGLQEAEKRMKVKTLPNVLALHLKRFKYQEDLGRYVKLSYRVVFPFHLRLPNTSDETDNPDRLYELFAFVVHIGGGPHHGHYVAIIKTSAGWMMFDDVNVSPVDEADIQRYFGESTSGSGYVLFYQAADLNSSSLGLRARQAPAPSPASDRPTKPSPSEPLNPPQASVATPPSPPSSVPRSIPTLHLPVDGRPEVAPEVMTPSSPSPSPTPPGEADDDPAELPSSGPPFVPRERFASAPAAIPSSPVPTKSDHAPLPHASPQRTPINGTEGPVHRRRSSSSGAEAHPPTVRRPSHSGAGGHARRTSHSGSPDAHPDSSHRTPGPPDLEPKVRTRRFSSMTASPTNPAAPPSSNSDYLQSLVTGRPKVETKEEKKAREQLEKERERAQKEREKLGREREKEREKAEKEREKLRREEEKADAARVAKLEKEMERRQRMQRKSSLPPPSAPEPQLAKGGGAMSKLAGLGRSPSMALFGSRKAKDKD